MDDGRDDGNVIQIIGGEGPRNGADNGDDQSIRATEDDYGAWDREAFVDTTSSLIYDGRQSQTRSESEPPNQKTSNTPEGGLVMMKAKVFFRTKLCCRFRAGICRNSIDCNYAHSIEELRSPQQNWKDFMAACKEERACLSEPREEFQIPSFGSSIFREETERAYKRQRCKKFYLAEGCPYGDGCTFLHDEESKGRERVAILLGPGCMDGGATEPAAAPPLAPPASNSTLKPPSWKTRICNKWEQTGYCLFGSKCIFAHGAAELHRYGGGPVGVEANRKKQGPVSSDVVVASSSSVVCADGSLRLLGTVRRPQKWKGPDKISRVYGDWID